MLGVTLNADDQIEASIDGGAYFAVGDALTAPGVVAVPQTVEFLRIRTTAYASGEPGAVFAGFDERAS